MGNIFNTKHFPHTISPQTVKGSPDCSCWSSLTSLSILLRQYNPLGIILENAILYVVFYS